MITLVANDIYRGPEPSTPVDIAQAKTMDIIFDLENDQETTRFAPAEVVYSPITFLQIYSKWHAVSAKKLDWMADFVWTAKGKRFIHCKHGEDRTGLLVATIRVKYCGRAPADAMTEARQFGYRWYINFGLNKTWEKWLAAR